MDLYGNFEDLDFLVHCDPWEEDDYWTADDTLDEVTDLTIPKCQCCGVEMIPEDHSRQKVCTHCMYH
jgi:hypothetical protein